jgi:sulfite reductase (NADPH) hemoprotein beta-component
MYRYDEFDAAFVKERTAQFSDQVARRLTGDLSEDQFRPLRLMNGLYLQLHAYMLRIAVPYGTMSSEQMRMLARIARTYDRGYGHFTTRQNIQFNWPKLRDIPKILADLASVEMHAIQTSGNCIRNITTDQFAGAAADEIIDPRPVAEILRQWSSLHPEFSYLPRKFKIAMTGSHHRPRGDPLPRYRPAGGDRRMGEIGWEVWVGGGLGRTPMIGKQISPFVPHEHLLAYLESILRVYNRYGRRDNKYKARIKILVHETGIDTIREQVEAEFAHVKGGRADPAAGRARPHHQVLRRSRAYELINETTVDVAREKILNPPYGRWLERNLNGAPPARLCLRHHLAQAVGGAPGDATDKQMDVVADLAERYSFDELRVSHEQNLVLPHVKITDLPDVYAVLVEHGLAEGNAGQITDIICCPGLDFCALANARSIPLAQELTRKFARAPNGRPRSATSRSRFRAASTPAATTMSATSASSASRRRAPSSTRSPLAATPPRTPPSATSSATASWWKRCRTPSSASSIPTSPAAKAPTNPSSPPSAASAKRPSRRRCTAMRDRSSSFPVHGGGAAESAALSHPPLSKTGEGDRRRRWRGRPHTQTVVQAHA